MVACPRRLGVLLLVGLGLVAAWRQQPPAPRGADAPPTEFSAARARERLVRILGEGEAPHPVGSAEGEAFLGRLLVELRDLGLEPALTRRFACGGSLGCARIANVVADLPGGAGPRITLVAHHDSRAVAPGAADAGAPVAVLLEVARALRAGEPTRHPVRLLFTDGEELDLVGAAAYAARPGIAEDTRAVLNFEARGTGGPSLMFETSSPAAPWIERFARRPRSPVTSSLFYEVYKVFPNDTDMTEFRAGGLAGLNFAFMSRPLQYHTPRDSLAHLSLASLQHHGDQALAAVRSVDEPGDLADPSAGDAVYFDLLSGPVLWWTPGAGHALAWAALALWCMALATLLHRERLGLLGLGGAGLALLAAPALALGAGALVEGLVRLCGALPGRWVAAPGALLVATRAAGALAALALGALAVRLGGAWAAAAALGAGTAGVAVALAYQLPGAGYLAMVPALASGALAFVLVGLERDDARGPSWLGLGPALAYGVVWLPLLGLLHDGLGFWVPGLHGLAAGLPMLWVAVLAPGWDRHLATGLALLVALGTGVALLRAPYTREHPRPLVLRYKAEEALPGAGPAPGEPGDAAGPRAEWIAVVEGPGLPAALREVAPFERTERTSHELKARHPLHVAEAPWLGIPGPEVSRPVLEPVEGGVRLRTRLRSRRGAFQLGFRFDTDPPPARLTIEGQVVYDRRLGLTGLRKMHKVPIPRVRVPPGEGVTVEADFPSRPRGVLRAWDESRGLPGAPGAALAAARPEHCAPAHEGDRTQVIRTLRLPPGPAPDGAAAAP